MRPRQKERGAAILLALLIMTLVATLAAGMVWLQWRGIEVEAAERARTQATWLLNASLDWGNLILKSSIRSNHTDDDLGQPWATPLAETKLSSFLSADGNHQDDSGPEAYLSGQITDAEGKYNLYNIVLDPGKFDEINRLKIICTAIGVPESVANTIGAGLRDSFSAPQNGTQNGQAGPDVLVPNEIADLAWYGVDPKVVKQLEPYVEILPPAAGQTPAISMINANTAPPEVLMAAIPGLTRAQAQQMVLARQTHPFAKLADAYAPMGWGATGPPTQPNPAVQIGVTSSHFEIYGQLRYEQHVIRELSVVYRKDQFTPVQVLRRERLPPDATVAAPT